MNWIAQRPAMLALILVVVASLRIVSTYRVLSHTTDEPAHLAAGIEWIQNGTYTYEDQHPPLARVTGALGLYLTGSRWTHRKDMYDEGYHLLGQRKRYNQALFYSRLFMLPFFWLGATAVYLWTFRIGGGIPAVFATLLYTTIPPILAHAGLATTDMALTAFVSASLVASLYWAENPNWRRSIALGALVGLALLSKFSTLAFLPAGWFFMYATHLAITRAGFRGVRRSIRTLAPWAAVAALVACILIWSAYNFDVGVPDDFNVTLPAPAFFSGIWHAYRHNTIGHLAYLLGQRSQSGFWYYYPVVLAVKTPLATMILMAAAIGIAPRRLAMPLALSAAILTVGLFSHINIGVRHILPIYTGFAICGGLALHRLFSLDRKWLAGIAAALIVWQVASGALEHPDYIAYTNELAGNHPERILVDSDLDWNQGMRGLAVRLEELGVRDFTFKMSGGGYIIAEGHSFPPYVPMPDGDKPNPGWNAVSLTEWKLTGQPKWAEHVEPTERIRRSIYLYYFPAPR